MTQTILLEQVCGAFRNSFTEREEGKTFQESVQRRQFCLVLTTDDQFHPGDDTDAEGFLTLQRSQTDNSFVDCPTGVDQNIRGNDDNGLPVR